MLLVVICSSFSCGCSCEYSQARVLCIYGAHVVVAVTVVNDCSCGLLWM